MPEGYQSEPTTSDSLLNNLSWQGVLVVAALDANGQTFPKRSGVFWTPQNMCPIRIVDADGTILSLVANDGSSFSFDVGILKYLSKKAGPQIQRATGNGLLIESGITQYHLDDYKFVNQWSSNANGESIMTLLAGNQTGDPRKGVLVLLVSSPGDSSKVVEEVAYLTDYKDGALRIIDEVGNKITLVSDSGLIYTFDVTHRQFTSLPLGSDAIVGIPIPKGLNETASGLLSATNTPTQTPTPRHLQPVGDGLGVDIEFSAGSSGPRWL
jgi:hypothetical protein